MLDHQATGRGQAHTLAAAHDQRHPNLALELGHLPRDGRLGEVEGGRRRGEGAPLAHLPERFHEAKIHSFCTVYAQTFGYDI